MTFLAATIPYKVGDKVSCRSGGVIYDGVGHVVEVSFDPKDLASPVIPMFRVEMDEKAYETMPDEMWYPELLLTPVEAANG